MMMLWRTCWCNTGWTWLTMGKRSGRQRMPHYSSLKGRKGFMSALISMQWTAAIIQRSCCPSRRLLADPS